MKRIIVFAMVGAFCLGAFTLHAENQKEPEKKVLASGVCPPFYLKDEGGNIIDPGDRTSSTKRALRKLSWLFIIAGALSGMLILLKIGGLSLLTRLAYTDFDLSLVCIAISSVISLIIRIGSDQSIQK